MSQTCKIIRDSANQQIRVEIWNGGALLATAIVPRYFSGNGPPAAATLAALVLYNQYDRYTDNSAKADYICTFGGTNATSSWAQISGGGGGGGYAGTYDSTKAYTKGSIVRVESAASIAGILPMIGVYGALKNVPANPTGNDVPQFPEGSTPSWHLLAAGLKIVNVCQGSSMHVYINSSDPF